MDIHVISGNKYFLIYKRQICHKSSFFFFSDRLISQIHEVIPYRDLFLDILQSTLIWASPRNVLLWVDTPVNPSGENFTPFPCKHPRSISFLPAPTHFFLVFFLAQDIWIFIILYPFYFTGLSLTPVNYLFLPIVLVVADCCISNCWIQMEILHQRREVSVLVDWTKEG